MREKICLFKHTSSSRLFDLQWLGFFLSLSSSFLSPSTFSSSLLKFCTQDKFYSPDTEIFREEEREREKRNRENRKREGKIMSPSVPHLNLYLSALATVSCSVTKYSLSLSLIHSMSACLSLSLSLSHPLPNSRRKKMRGWEWKETDDRKDQTKKDKKMHPIGCNWERKNWGRRGWKKGWRWGELERTREKDLLHESLVQIQMNLSASFSEEERKHSTGLFRINENNFNLSPSFFSFSLFILILFSSRRSWNTSFTFLTSRTYPYYKSFWRERERESMSMERERERLVSLSHWKKIMGNNFGVWILF